MIETAVADLIEQDVDAIVNAANEQLREGGGVCGAIFRAAGATDMQRACDDVAPCPTGEARATPGFALPARYVIHAVGPMWHGGNAGEPALLASAYRSAVELAKAHGWRSIAFPAVSTGIYGFPFRQATEVAVAALKEALAEPGSVDRVLLVFRDESSKRIADEVLNRG